MALSPTNNESLRASGHDGQRTLVANIGHEIKTPASALCVLAEALASDCCGTDQAQLALRIHGEAKRLCSTVDELVDSGAHRILPEASNGKALVRTATERLSLAADIEEIDLVISGDDEVQMFGNPVEIVSAVHHLVENAIKHSQPGSRVEVAVRANGDYGEIDVSDAGIGIDPLHHDAIFERHFSMNSTGGRGNGSGLGLNIVKQAAANNSGEVVLQSAVGRGTTFTLRIPRGASHV